MTENAYFCEQLQKDRDGMKNKKKRLSLQVAALIIGVAAAWWIAQTFAQQPDVADGGGRVVVCIPVYGQSLALGEEALGKVDSVPPPMPAP